MPDLLGRRPVWGGAPVSERRMTPDQARAVETVTGDVAISAGAGSGKTTVLAARFAHALSPAADAPWAPATIGEMLTITFTRKAAGEIAERVRRVVGETVSREQSRKVDEAWISTIHTLCGRLLRRHILEAGVEPGYSQADETLAALLKEAAFEKACAGLCEADPAVLSLVETWDYLPLRTRTIAACDNIRALGLDPAEALVPCGCDDVERLRWQALRTARLLADEIAARKQTPAVIRRSEALCAWTLDLERCDIGSPGDCAKVVELASNNPLNGFDRSVRAEFDETLNRLLEAAGAVSATDAVQAFERLLRAYAETYAELKRDRNVLDFDDLQELAVHMLESHPDITALYRNRFKLLMVDEFQDTNELQMRVLSHLRNDNLCIVGDERQSIYGFRYADVEIFERLRQGMDTKIELNANFRSHEQILGFVNGAFSQAHLFGAEFMQLAAGRQGGGIELEGPRVECMLVDLDSGVSVEGAVNAEACEVAARIRGLVDGGVKGCDIAILLRASTHANKFARALAREGVATLVTAGSSLFEGREFAEVRALLRCVAVPHDDEALATVLASRIVSLSPDALMGLRAWAGRRSSLWDALGAVGTQDGPELPHGDVASAVFARDQIDRLGCAQGPVSLGDLVIDACEAFDYDLVLHSCGDSGVGAWRNVVKLARLARGFEEARGADLAGFVDHLDRRAEDEAESAAPGEVGENTVRIMTVHSAKGLEFPVVFAAGLGGSKGHAVDQVLVGRREDAAGVAAVVGIRLPSEPFGSAATPLYQELARQKRARELEEQKRCLYVQVTRARDLLVMSGVTALSKPAASGSRLIDWVRESLGDPTGPGAVAVGSATVSVTVVEPQVEEPDEDPTEPAAEEWCESVWSSSQLTAEREAGAPRTVSYSGLHRFEQCPLSYAASARYGMVSFRGPDELATTDFGSAFHEVLERSSEGFVDEAAVSAAVRRNGLSGGDEARLRDTARDFLDSPLARRVATAARCLREAPLRVALVEGTSLVGSIDLVAWFEDEAVVVDYKTGNAPDSDSPRMSGYLLQAQCYALAVLEAGASRVEVVFAFVESAGSTVEFRFDRTETQRLREALVARVQEISKGGTQHLDAYDREICGGCPALGSLCPIRPPGRPGAG